MSLLRKKVEQERSHKSSDDLRYLEFNLGRERFAIPLLSVKEVIAVPETTKVPFTPEYFIGIMNLRGQVLSVIDLRRRLGITEQHLNPETAVIITDLGYTQIGCVVDSINRVLAVGEQELAPPPEIERNLHTDFITGCYRGERHLILFLDINRILDAEDKDLLTRSAHMNNAS